MIPTYTLRPRFARGFVPHLLLTILLATILFIAILINLRFLDVPISAGSIILTSSVILVVIVLDSILYYTKFRREFYDLYPDQIISSFTHQHLYWAHAQDLNIRRNIFDRIFGTITIILTDHFRINYAPDDINLINYIGSLITMNRGSR